MNESRITMVGAALVPLRVVWSAWSWPCGLANGFDGGPVNRILSCVEIARYILALVMVFAEKIKKLHDYAMFLFCLSFIVILLQVASLMAVIDDGTCLDMPGNADEVNTWFQHQALALGWQNQSAMACNAAVQKPYFWQNPSAWCADKLTAAGCPRTSSNDEVQYCVRTGVTNIVAGSDEASTLSLLADVFTAVCFRMWAAKSASAMKKPDDDASKEQKPTNSEDGSKPAIGVINDNSSPVGNFTSNAQHAFRRRKITSIPPKHVKLDLGGARSAKFVQNNRVHPLRFS